VAVLAVALLFLTVPVHAQPGPPAQALEVLGGHQVAAGEVLVKFRRATADVLRQVRVQEDLDEIEDLGSTGALRLRSRSKNVVGLLRSLAARGDVEYVEPNYIVHTTTQLPNDPSFGQLWGLRNTGQSIGGVAGTPGADIKAADAWDTSKGSTDNVVGIIDTGIDYNHPDLAANMWAAPFAFSVTVGGQVISCAAGTRGLNAILNTCNPMDDNNHGTHVAGTIGAAGNNGVGVTGVNWTTRMLGLKFLSANGSGSTANAVKAIDFAVQLKVQNIANVRVLSNSWGGGGYSLTLHAAIIRANNEGIVFVAAAGNAGTNNDTSPFYPAGYDVANVVAVAATDNRDNLASFSNYGKVSVDLGAPGVSILSTIRNSSYAYFNGTSMATPHVSGAAALVMAACPQLTGPGVISAILNNVDPIPALATNTYTGGRLNVQGAIQSCLPTGTPDPDFTVSANPTSLSVVRGGASAQSAISFAPANGFNENVSLTVTGVPANASASFDPATVTNLAGGSTLTVAAAAGTPTGNYPLTITAVGGGLTRTTTVTLAVRDFTVSASPASQSVTQGSTASYSVSTAALNGFTGTIDLAVTGTTAATLNPTSVAVGGTSTLTVANAAVGTHTFTITGTSAGVSRTATVTLVVNAPPTGTFGISVTPSSRTVTATSSTTYAVDVSSQNGFSGVVSLSVTGLPTGGSASFSPSSVSAPGSSTMTVSTSGNTPSGTYTLIVRGTSGGQTVSQNVSLTVQCKASGKCK
jgi:hypothetical protein